MRYKKFNCLLASAALLGAAAGCGSSKPAAGASASKTITIGVLADLTGPASADDTTVPQGVRAGVGLAAIATCTKI